MKFSSWVSFYYKGKILCSRNSECGSTEISEHSQCECRQCFCVPVGSVVSFPQNCLLPTLTYSYCPQLRCFDSDPITSVERIIALFPALNEHLTQMKSLQSPYLVFRIRIKRLYVVTRAYIFLKPGYQSREKTVCRE